MLNESGPRMHPLGVSETISSKRKSQILFSIFNIEGTRALNLRQLVIIYEHSICELTNCERYN